MVYAEVRVREFINSLYLISSFGSSSSSSFFLLFEAGVEFGVLAAEDYQKKTIIDLSQISHYIIFKVRE